MELPEWIDEEDWKGYVDMRKRIKKPLTDRAAKQSLKALGILKEKGQDPNFALQFAEYQGNRGIFPVPPWYFKMMGISETKKENELGNF